VKNSNDEITKLSKHIEYKPTTYGLWKRDLNRLDTRNDEDVFTRNK